MVKLVWHFLLQRLIWDPNEEVKENDVDLLISIYNIYLLSLLMTPKI